MAQRMSRVMTEWTVSQHGGGYVLSAPDHQCPCLIGKAGTITATAKREGDMASPIGSWPLRRVFFRPDRIDPPDTALPTTPIHEGLGWCDDPADPAYNRLVERPFAASHETMWRADHLYDLVVELGYNDAPPVAGHGSAIFLHLREAHTTHTAGCVAVTRADLLRLLADADTATRLCITG